MVVLEFFTIFAMISPRTKTLLFIWTNLNPLYQRTIYVKFGSIWSNSSAEEVETEKLGTDKWTIGNQKSITIFHENIPDSLQDMQKIPKVRKTKTRCVVNATNAPALSQSFKAKFNLIQFQGDNCQKSLDQQFQPNKSLRMETENFIFFCNSITKYELDLPIPLTYLHVQFQPYTCIQTKVREWKLKISIFFKVQEE
jgi:hypothetical protein